MMLFHADEQTEPKRQKQACFGRWETKPEITSTTIYVLIILHVSIRLVCDISFVKQHLHLVLIIVSYPDRYVITLVSC